MGRDLEEQRQARDVAAWQGKRLLLAVGNPERSGHLKRQLAAWGFHVTVANDAWDALREMRAKLLLEECFDLALIDQDMPGKRGEELCREFRAAEGASEMKIVLMSAPGLDEPAGESAWDLRLQAPLKFGSLHRALQEACGVESSPLLQRRSSDRELVESTVGLRVLIAEDDPVNRKVLGKLLERLHCTVDHAADGSEAAERVLAGDYHLVFMDCNMPGLNGFDASRLIRVQEAASDRHTIIIAMTANARSSTREQCLEAGMDDYITKPVRVALLAETLDRWKAGDDALTLA